MTFSINDTEHCRPPSKQFIIIMLSVIVMNVLILSVIILNVVKLNVMAPLQQVALAFWALSYKTFEVKLLILLSKLFHFITITIL
jgi:hypothetical protein